MLAYWRIPVELTITELDDQLLILPMVAVPQIIKTPPLFMVRVPIVTETPDRMQDCPELITRFWIFPERVWVQPELQSGPD